MKSLDNLKDFGEYVITLQESVIKKFLQGFMAPKQKKKKKQGSEESSAKAEEVDEEKRLAEEARVGGGRRGRGEGDGRTDDLIHVLVLGSCFCVQSDFR